ncbi:hypothetical protein HY450_00575 [Candidatus Pacearchaeota archaeon]|nr:hypothetical protein [Candidatus Pacearchaeota archaeon]
MKKGALILFLALAILIPSALADPIDETIKKITYHAEQYESGNINYAQLVVYTSTLSRDLAEAMGATSREHDPVLKAEQLESALGKPTETTKWVWVDTRDGNGYEKKLDSEASAWRKLIFDGKRIQLWLSAWPNIEIKNNEEILFYRLHLETLFKSQKGQINIKEKIEEITLLAEKYSESPGKENLDSLAKESVNAEQSFSNFFNQNPADCEEIMNDLFGSENKREDQKILIQEIVLYAGDNFEAIIRFEGCENCNWKWLNPTDIRIEGRGPEFRQQEFQEEFPNSRGKFSSFTTEDFKQESRKLVDDMKSDLEAGNYQSAMQKSHEFRALAQAWDEYTNDVNKELEQNQNFWETMSEEERQECQRTYCWIKKDQERREAEKELRAANYEERKAFYSELFAGYEKKEFYYEQEQWEKRLVEKFKEFGEEICSNNIDDNNNQQIDCAESQCGGKVCGYETVMRVGEDNQTSEEKIELYCIAGTCQAKEEIVEEKVVVCGNHLCEENEQETCAEDCTACFQHEPLECSGQVIFSGADEKGCPLEPVCLLEDLSCETDEDCIDPLCGDASCVEGACQITQLTECREPECVDGERKINHCSSGEEVVVEECTNGLWRETGVECEEGISETAEEIEEIEVVGDECVVKSDCGNENDVCSNGRCVTLPESIRSEEQEIQDSMEVEETTEEIPESQEQQESEQETEEIPEVEPEQTPEITGNVIFSFFRTLASRMKITGFTVGDGGDAGEGENPDGEEGTGESGGGSEEGANEQENENPEGNQNEQNEDSDNSQESNSENRDDEREDEERRERDEGEDRQGQERDETERRENECGERCNRECYDREIRPCVEGCIREDCGEELECKVDEVRVSCEAKCEGENSLDLCKSECSEKCLKGEDTWIEPEREQHKEERFVFTVGGSCRESQGKTESFVWFGGWAGDRNDEFNNFHLIKNKYYSQGGNDWCGQDLENLLKQRKELENSLNEEFARWFFEQYVANSAEDWEKHISGIYEIYWRDVDISRQITERLQCLGEASLPPHELINFKYETEYGSVEFWEEIKTTSQFGEGEREIISPYMKTWLFPSREFFKLEMKKSMEAHKLPGPPEQEKTGRLSEEEKQDLREDEEFMRAVREFNDRYGENFVLQLKDFETGEIVFNVYGQINEKELMYFEPMPPAGNPGENVKVELDVDKLLNIVSEEQRRVELESPPWDRKPREGNFVKRTTDGVKMYIMFRSLMNSAVVTPENAESHAKFFTRQFFERVMGDGEHENEEGREGPGGCKNEEECREYCENPDNRKECSQFRDDFEEDTPSGWEDKESLTGEVVRN